LSSWFFGDKFHTVTLCGVFLAGWMVVTWDQCGSWSGWRSSAPRIPPPTTRRCWCRCPAMVVSSSGLSARNSKATVSFCLSAFSQPFVFKLSPTLHVPYQFDPSSSPSSSPSSRSDPGPLVDLSRGIFHFRLKSFLFSKSFPP